MNNSLITAKLPYLKSKIYMQLQNERNYFPTSRKLSPHPTNIEMKTGLPSRREPKGNGKTKKNHPTINFGARMCDLGLWHCSLSNVLQVPNTQAWHS